MSYQRREQGSTSIFSTPSKPKPSRSEENTFVNYDYLDGSDHAGYTNAWLNAVSFNKVSVDYDDEYADNWVKFMKTKERKVIKYNRSELFQILFKMSSVQSPAGFSSIIDTMYQPIGFSNISNTIYQPIRQPNNPPDSIVKGFAPFTPTYQLCPKCRARIN